MSSGQLYITALLFVEDVQRRQDISTLLAEHDIQAVIASKAIPADMVPQAIVLHLSAAEIDREGVAAVQRQEIFGLPIILLIPADCESFAGRMLADNNAVAQVLVCDEAGRYRHLLPAQIKQVVRTQRSAERLRMLNTAMSNMQESVLITDAQLNRPGPRILYANESFEKMTGYAFEEIHGRTPRLLQGEQTNPDMMRGLRKTLEAERPFSGETVNYRKDGTPYHVEWTISPVYNDAGEVTHFVSIQRDITARKQATESLRRMSDQRRRLLDVAHLILSRFAEGDILPEISSAIRKFIYYDLLCVYMADTAVDTGCLQPIFVDGTHPLVEKLADREITIGDDLVSRVFLDEKVRLANHISGSDVHTVHPVEGGACEEEHVIAIPFRFDGRVAGVFVYGRVDGRPFTDEAFELIQLFSSYAALALENARFVERLRVSEHKYRTLFEQSRDGVFICDEGGRLIDANPVLAEMMGYKSPASMIDAVDDICYVLAGNDEPRLRRRMQEQGFVENYEAEVERVDGEMMTVSLSAVILRDETDDELSYRGTVRDITEQMRMEEAMRRAQKLESLGVMAGGIAHDFNNLLASISAHAAAAMLNIDSNHAARPNLNQVIHTTTRAADLTDKLLAYSGKSHTEIEPTNINDLIRENLSLLETSIPRTVSLTAELDDGVPNVAVDVGQMQQVIMNLVMNAAEAYDGTPGQVTVCTAHELVETPKPTRIDGQKMLAPGEYVVLSVGDEGKGMAQATMERIFDPFFTTKITGRGLGLATVHGIVRSHNGDIHVQSAPGEGTMFHVYLPATTQKVRELPAGEGAIATHPGTASVLIVDDERSLRAAFASLLELSGFEVETAENGRVGLEKFQANQDRIDLVLLDLTMPVMSGEETLRNLRKIAPDLPVVILSGYSEDMAVEHLKQFAPIDFLKKPVKLDVLLTKIAEVLSKQV